MSYYKHSTTSRGIVGSNFSDSGFLSNFCSSDATSEAALYPAFVHAANAALFHLQHLSIDNLREASDSLIFHAYTKEIRQSYQGATSVSKPDVVLVSSADAEVGDISKGPPESAAQKPKKNFSWRDLRTIVELKFVQHRHSCTASQGNRPRKQFLVPQREEPSSTQCVRECEGK